MGLRSCPRRSARGVGRNGRMKTSSFAAQAVGPRAACAAEPPAKTPAGGSVCVAGKKRNAGSVDREPVSKDEGKPACSRQAPPRLTSSFASAAPKPAPPTEPPGLRPCRTARQKPEKASGPKGGPELQVPPPPSPVFS